MKQFVLLWIFFGWLSAKPQDGTLDLSFAGRGYTSLHYLYGGNNFDELPRRSIIQSDGKILVVFEGQRFLARYNADGSLDKTFGENGFAGELVNFGAKDAVQLSDGKLVVAGDLFPGGTADFALVRFLPNGILDTTFGTKGIVTADFFGGNDIPVSMVLQGDGKFVVAGNVFTTNGDQDIGLARFTADGALDPDFDGDGKLTTNIATDPSGNSLDVVNTMTIQSDQKILVAGNFYGVTTNFQSIMTVLRYNSDGSPDTGFGTDGIYYPNFPAGSNSDILGISESGGKIIITGNLSLAGEGGFPMRLMIMRLTVNGTPDADFDSDGLVTVDFGADMSTGKDCVFLSDGNILVLGDFSTTAGFDLAVLRVLPDGSLDATFDTDGIVTSNLGFDQQYPESLTLLSDGFIATAQVMNPSAGNGDIALVRYNSNGGLVNSFSGDGILISYYMKGTSSDVLAVATQPDGKVIAAGKGYNESTNAYALSVARFNTNGSLDQSFGDAGVASVYFDPNIQTVTAVALQSDGTIVAGGNVETTLGTDFAIARFTSAGVPDANFGTDGKIIYDFDGYDYLSSLAVQSDGNILAVGGTSTSNFSIVRFLPNGTVDANFGTDGKVIIDFYGETDDANAVKVQTDGKIIVAGETYNTDIANYSFAAVRLTSAGALDNTFGTGGKAVIDFGAEADARGDYVLIQDDGKYVIGGTENVQTGLQTALVRLTSAGVLDPTFGTGGKVETAYTGEFSFNGLALQSDNKIIAGGDLYDGSHHFLSMTRYATNGSLDASFGTAGKVVSDMGEYVFPYAFAWDNGRIYAAGETASLGETAGWLAAFKAAAVPAGLPSISINNVTVSEDVGKATLTLSLNKTSATPIVVSYQTEDKSATSKGRTADYRMSKGSITIPANTLTGAISVTINNDNLTEGIETFNVIIKLNRKMVSLATIADSLGVVTISANDGALKAIGANDHKNRFQKETGIRKFAAVALPNPTSNYFTLLLQSGNSMSVSINIIDASGRLVERKTGAPANGSLMLGANYRPGLYYAQLIQGNQRLMLKLVKQ